MPHHHLLKTSPFFLYFTFQISIDYVYVNMLLGSLCHGSSHLSLDYDHSLDYHSSLVSPEICSDQFSKCVLSPQPIGIAHFCWWEIECSKTKWIYLLLFVIVLVLVLQFVVILLHPFTFVTVNFSSKMQAFIFV